MPLGTVGGNHRFALLIKHLRKQLCFVRERNWRGLLLMSKLRGPMLEVFPRNHSSILKRSGEKSNMLNDLAGQTL